MPLVNKPSTSYGVTYNGFQFDPNTTETLGITSECVYDEAQRTIVYVKYTLELRSIIYGRTTDSTGPEGQFRTDDQLDVIRKKLQSPAGSLFYSDRGFGEVVVNAGGRQHDVAFGPKPLMLKWVPWGDANAAEIVWQVSFCIPECDNAKFRGELMEFNWRISFNIDADGFTTRKISGYATIPMTRRLQGNRKPPDSVDLYREEIFDLLPDTPEGFRPTVKNFTISEDKRRLDFETEEEEFGPNLPPPGVIRAEASLEVANEGPVVAARFRYQLRVTYDLVRKAPADIARVHFQKLRDTRKRIIEQQLKRKRIFGSIIPWEFRAAEPQIYGKVKKCSFVFSFIVVTKKALPMMTAGLWEPVPHEGEDKWRAKATQIFGPRGVAGLKLDADADIIVDLCAVPAGERSMKSKKNEEDRSLSSVENEPERETGWVLYSHGFRLIEHNSTMVHKPLVESTLSPNDPKRKSIVAERCMPTYIVEHYGRAMRMNEPVPPPRIERIGTFELIPANRDSEYFEYDSDVGIEGDIVYIASWVKRYVVPTHVGQNGPVFHPLHDLGDTYLTFGPDSSTLRTNRPDSSTLRTNRDGPSRF